MHPKSLNILIHRRLSKFFSLDDFELAGGWKGFFSDIGSLSKLFLSKLDINITKDKKRHALTTSMLMLTNKKVF